MASFKQDSSGNWKKTESKKKNYTIVDGKKVEKTEEKKTGLSDSWKKDTVSLEEAKQQSSEADAYMSQSPDPVTQPEQQQVTYTEVEPTYTPSPTNPNYVAPVDASKLKIDALNTKYQSGNSLEGSSNLTPSETVVKQQQIDRANNIYDTGAAEPYVQKYESGASKVSDASYHVVRNVTNSPKIASGVEGITSAIVQTPSGIARLAVGLSQNPVQVVSDVPTGIVKSFKDNPYKATGEVIGSLVVGGVAGKGIGSKLKGKPKSVNYVDTEYQILKGYETIKQDGVVTNKLKIDTIPVDDPSVSHFTPEGVKASIAETTKDIPAKYTHTKIVNGKATMETGETVIHLTKPTKLSPQQTLFDNEIVLGNGFEKYKSYKNPTYERTIENIDAPNGEDLMTLITEERNANTIISTSTSKNFQIDATIPKTEGSPYRTLYEYDAVIKNKYIAAMNGEDIIKGRTVEYYKHSDEMIPLDNIEAVKGRFFDRQEPIAKPTSGQHGNSADVFGTDSTPWEMKPIDNYESFKLSMDDPVGEDVLRGTIGRSGKLPKELDINNDIPFLTGKYVKMDGVTKYGSQLEGKVKVSGKEKSPITPDIIKGSNSPITKLDDELRHQKKSLPYKELSPKNPTSPKTVVPRQEIKQLQAPKRLSEKQVIGYEMKSKTKTIPPQPMYKTGFALGVASSAAIEFAPTQSINQIQYPMPRQDIRQSINPVIGIIDKQSQENKQNQIQNIRQNIRQQQTQIQEPIPRPTPRPTPTINVRMPKYKSKIDIDTPNKKKKQQQPLNMGKFKVKKNSIKNVFKDPTKMRK